jgi:membrane protein implicated in regulation of membrane protease activity
MKVWRIVLAIYLILCGLFWLAPGISFPAQGVITGVLAIVAAIFLLTDRSTTRAS